MHPPNEEELKALLYLGKIDERLEFARRLGNHRLKRRLREPLIRAHRDHLLALGVPKKDANLIVPALPPPAWRGMPTTGTRKIFVLLVEFRDHKHVNSERDVESAFFGRNGPGAPYESLAAYYDRSSYGKLDLHGGATLGWYSAPYSRAAVVESGAGRECLIKEALEHFHSGGHEFGQYDTDNDGVVDFFMVLWAGPDTGWGTFWWAYQATFGDQTFSLDGVKFGEYAWSWESRPLGEPYDVATAIHELGHALGLPDYYDYKKAQGPAGGVGGLDMMDSAKYDHNCFSKWLLGWVTPHLVSRGSEAVELRTTKSLRDCLVLYPVWEPRTEFSEFFMAENRWKLGNDSGLPGEGLIIWHVDAHLKDGDFARNNSTTETKLLRLMEADGLEEIEAGGAADARDFYSSGTSFGSVTVPSSSRYDGRESGVEIRNITAERGRISATVAVAGSNPRVGLPNSQW